MLTRPFLSAAACLAAAAASAGADTIDLASALGSGTINGAIFRNDSTHPAGTGVIDSFLRVQANGTESGYNTSVPSQQFGRDEVPGNFTRDLTLGEVIQVMEGGTSYYAFGLDINESSGGDNSLLTLDDVQIYTSPTAHADYKMNLADLGTLVYSMDMGEDSRVELDFDLIGGGSGTADMIMLVPASAFGGAGPETFVYLFSSFGTPNSSGAGFEEWFTIIPLPAPGAMAGAGLFLLAARRRRR